MAGILDEVMDGIAAKEETPATPPTQETAEPKEDKALHGYSDDFKKKYGERK